MGDRPDVEHKPNKTLDKKTKTLTLFLLYFKRIYTGPSSIIVFSFGSIADLTFFLLIFKILQKSKTFGDKILKLIRHKPSLGLCEVPHKI